MTDPKHSKMFDLTDLELGKPTAYATHYDVSLLQPVPRSMNRAELGVVDSQPFTGEDVWHGYEVSWLNAKGKPQVALLRCSVPYNSPNIVESKSFKLYLNSFNQTRFKTQAKVIDILTTDLSNVAGAPVLVELFGPEETSIFQSAPLPGICLDAMDIEFSRYDFDADLLKGSSSEFPAQQDVVEEVLYSHLLKSNCLITNQPDWASVIIEYQGEPIAHESLLRYLVSFRQHNEFHEQCVERIFMDLYRRFDLAKLSVQALYTRRGGLDINPYRTTEAASRAPLRRTNRQ